MRSRARGTNKCARGEGIPLEKGGGDGAPSGAKVVLAQPLARLRTPCGAPSNVFAMGAALSKGSACARPVCAPHPTGMKCALQPAERRAVPDSKSCPSVSELLAGGRNAPGRCSPIARARACEARPRTPVLLRQQTPLEDAPVEQDGSCVIGNRNIVKVVFLLSSTGIKIPATRNSTLMRISLFAAVLRTSRCSLHLQIFTLSWRKSLLCGLAICILQLLLTSKVIHNLC